MTDDLEAFRAQSPMPRRQARPSGNDAAMRVARWRWVVMPMVVLIVGCLPRPTPVVPESLISQFGTAATFVVQTPPVGATADDAVAALRARNSGPMFRGRVVPVLGLMDCHGDPECVPSPGVAGGGGARSVWVLLYPDCTDPTQTDIGWVVVDAMNGVASGYAVNNPCEGP